MVSLLETDAVTGTLLLSVLLRERDELSPQGVVGDRTSIPFHDSVTLPELVILG